MLLRFDTILAGLLQGVGVTLGVTFGALLIAIILGFALALLRVFWPSRIGAFVIDAYIELFRNIPALAHLFLIYYGLASVGVQLGSVTAAILGLGLIGGASLCDVFRAGFEALHKGQREAALAIGMRPSQAIRLILTPQALRIALPPVGNYATQLLKDSSIASAIAAPEIMFFARSLVTSTFETTLIYVTAAGLYILMSLPIVFAVRALEKRYAGGQAA
ncbi:MAG: amino acid ABC transporter permease [Beijerinckiaceae bacterium]|jgi:polar amino acid transport system permease protein|nr:amino acid ABC transporter permease [Beijerinckiaceae bacterium]